MRRGKRRRRARWKWSGGRGEEVGEISSFPFFSFPSLLRRKSVLFLAPLFSPLPPSLSFSMALLSYLHIHIQLILIERPMQFPGKV